MTDTRDSLIKIADDLRKFDYYEYQPSAAHAFLADCAKRIEAMHPKKEADGSKAIKIIDEFKLNIWQQSAGQPFTLSHDIVYDILNRVKEALQSGAGDAQIVPTGWVLVPIEPNWDMRNEGREFLIDGIEKEPEKLAYFLWKTMVAASPKAPAHPPVAGLAELTPKQWGDLYEAIANTNLSDEAIFTAAREFLGKVDG